MAARCEMRRATDDGFTNDSARIARSRHRMSGTEFAPWLITMSLVRLLGFTTLACGCVVGRYREVATSRELTYVEEKGKSCGSHSHRRNHTVADRVPAVAAPVPLAIKAS
jgi:hypothetical protein